MNQQIWNEHIYAGETLEPANRISTKNKIKYLKRVKELISTPDKWVRSHYAKLKNGEGTKNLRELHDGDCAAYCLMGAVYKVLRDDSLPAVGLADELRKTLRPDPGNSRILNEFNDGNEHSDAINLINLTIERLQETV